MSEYEQFIWLYSLIERRLQRLENQGVRKPWDKDLDDLFRRMLRDMDRKGSLPALLPQPDGAARRIDPSQYVWAELDRERYRSRFLPMRIHDLVRDDCAYRRWRRETQI